jgi:tyrosine aminotransferase
VYSAEHLQEIVQVCEKHHLPIVADEVYGDLVLDDFNGQAFVPVATVAARLGRQVPIITASGIGKQFLLPGWRVGWICFQDKYVPSVSCR